MSSAKQWWCTIGTHAIIVPAYSKEGAQKLAAERMNDARRRTFDRIRPLDVHAVLATDVQVRRYQELTGTVPA